MLSIAQLHTKSPASEWQISENAEAFFGAAAGALFARGRDHIGRIGTQRRRRCHRCQFAPHVLVQQGLHVHLPLFQLLAQFDFLLDRFHQLAVDLKHVDARARQLHFDLVLSSNRLVSCLRRYEKYILS